MLIKIVTKERYYKELEKLYGKDPIEYNKIYCTEILSSQDRVEILSKHVYYRLGDTDIYFVYILTVGKVLIPDKYDKDSALDLIKNTEGIDLSNWKVERDNIKKNYLLNTYLRNEYPFLIEKEKNKLSDGDYVIINKDFPDDKEIKFSIKIREYMYDNDYDEILLAFPEKEDPDISIEKRQELSNLIIIILSYGKNRSRESDKGIDRKS